MNVVIYARYSSDRQTEKSIEGQLQECCAYAQRNGYTVIHEYIDRSYTGTNDSRPQFLRMIEDSKKKLFQGVVVYQFDRFARNRFDSSIYKTILRKEGIRVLSACENVPDDPSGALVEGILESVAEFYSRDLSRKVNRGMQLNAQKCLSNGGTIPFGYKSVDKHLVIDEDTAPIVRKIFEMYARGKRIVDIINYLNELHIKTATGSKFNNSSLHTILKNKKYIGVYKFGDVEVPDGVPRIVSDELFYKVAEILNKNKRYAGRGKAKVEYLLTTKLFCGHCHSMMVGISERSATGRVYHYYSCNKAREKACKKKNVSKERIEDIVVQKCLKLLTDETIKKISNEIAALSEREQDTTELKRLKKRLKETDRAIENLLKALESGQNMDIIGDRITLKRKERDEIEKDIAIEKMRHLTLSATDIRFFLTQLKNGDINDIKYRRALINIFVNAIYLYDDNKLTIVFNASDIPVTVDDILLDEIETANNPAQGFYTNGCGSPHQYYTKSPGILFSWGLCYYKISGRMVLIEHHKREKERLSLLAAHR